MTDRPYSQHLDTVTALVTYLALTNKKSRTAEGIASDLGIEVGEVRATVVACPGLFYKKQSQAGIWYYTLHARYALRPYDLATDEDLPEVRPDLLSVLLTFATQRARDEVEDDRFALQLQAAEKSASDAKRAANVAAIVAAFAALCALLGAGMSAFAK